MRRAVIGVLVVGSVATLGACVRRTELITVLQDGSARWLVVMEGDPEDVREGDAIPSAADGWKIAEERVIDQQGDPPQKRREQMWLAAQRVIRPGGVWPVSFAAPGGEAERLVLNFQTEIRVERRPEGVYYHLRREFRPRSFARFDYFRRKTMEQDNVKKLTQTDPDELTDEQRRELTTVLIGIERERTREFLYTAFQRMDPAPPQEAFLTAVQRGLSVYDQPAWVDEALTLVGGEDSAEGRSAEGLERALLKDVERDFVSELAERKVATAAIDRFTAEYHAVRTAYKVTEDLADDAFRLFVVMPGRIIAHDLTKEPEPLEAFWPPDVVEGDAPEGLGVEGYLAETRRALGDGRYEGGVWEFDGDGLADRGVVLMVTSFVANAGIP
jgi:hypothetical protein